MHKSMTKTNHGIPLHTVSAIRHILPNCPDEVIGEWLGYYAKEIGWPPFDLSGSPVGRWAKILLNRPLSYWRGLRWNRWDIRLAREVLSPPSLRRIDDMVAAYVGGVPNAFLCSIPDGLTRFRSITAFVQEHGTVPGSVIAVRESGGLGIVDGNHRVAAYLHCAGRAGRPPVAARITEAGAVSVWIGNI